LAYRNADSSRIGRVVPSRLIPCGPEGRDFAVALPKLHVVTVNELSGVLLRRIVITTDKFDYPKKPAIYPHNEGPIFGHLRCRSHGLPDWCAFLHNKFAPKTALKQENNSKFNMLSAQKADFRIFLPRAEKHSNLFNE
jgi:hypothetical protein